MKWKFNLIFSSTFPCKSFVCFCLYSNFSLSWFSLPYNSTTLDCLHNKTNQWLSVFFSHSCQHAYMITIICTHFNSIECIRCSSSNNNNREEWIVHCQINELIQQNIYDFVCVKCVYLLKFMKKTSLAEEYMYATCTLYVSLNAKQVILKMWRDYELIEKR